MLKVTALWVNRLLWTVLVTALVLVATYVSIGRYYIGYVEQYQQPLLQRIADVSGLALKVDRLHGRWSQLSPVLTMEQLTLYGPAEGDDAVLTIQNISFQLDLLNSLINGALQVKHLQIAGVECSLQEVEPGRWQLKGYPAASEGSNFDTVIDLVLSVASAELVDGQFQLFFQQGSSALLEAQELSLQHEGDFRRLRVQAAFDQSKNLLAAVVEAQGDPRDRETFSARGWLKQDDVDYSAQMPALQVLGIDVKDARVDSELWLDWQPGTAIGIQGNVSIPLLDIAALSGEELAPLKDLQFTFRAEKTVDDDWQVWLPRLQAHWQQQPFTFEQMVLTLDTDYARLSMPGISLDQTLQQLMAIELLGDRGRETIQTLSPTGTLNNVHLNLSRHVADAEQYSSQPRFKLQANLADVGISPWKGAPGASGVNGYLEVVPDGGMVELDSQQFSMDFPVVYHHSLAFESGRAQVQWHIDEHRIRVNSGPIYLQGDHGPATGLLSLDLPANSEEPDDPVMTLMIGLRDTDASHRNKFIPYTLNQGFLDWMAGSVPSGHVIDGGFIFRGSLSKDDAADRTVQLYFNIDNTALDYHPDWPALSDISGMVLIDDASVDVSTRRAKLFQLDIPKAHVQAQPRQEGGMWLSVNASAKGSANDALRVVNESVIHSIVGSVFENWQLDGEAIAEVNLGVPLAGAEAKPVIDVTVNLDNSNLLIPDYRLHFNKLSGPIHYSSEEGIASSGISGSFYNKPAMVTVKQSAQGAVSVAINGRLTMADVAQWSQQPALDFTSGETDFKARVYVPGKENKPGEFTLTSSLAGVAIDLPAPYNKSVDSEHPFWLSLPLAEDKPLLRMGLENKAELQLRLAQGQMQSGLVILDSTDNLQHRAGYLTVTGRAEYVDIDQWQPVLERYLIVAEELAAKEKPLDVKITNATDSKPVTTQAEPIQVSIRDLSLTQFKGFKQHFGNTLVNAERQSNSWWLSIDNNVASGELILPDQKTVPLTFNFQRLQLPESILADAETKSGGLSAIDPASLNKLAADVSIKDLMLGEQHYGQMSFELRSNESGLKLNNLRADIRGIAIGSSQPAALEWWRTEQGDQSRFYGDYSFGDLGTVLESWHYEKIIESKQGSGSLDLTWPGRPDEWLLAASEGPIYLNIKDGRFLKTSDATAGTLKVVGIVNFTNIIRRLQLDFSDLYKSGISYDKIDGELVLSAGELIIIDDLTVKTPSSRFHLKGRADMVQGQLDMELIATLPVANNLPWIAALIGGVPTAAGVYVASKIFQNQFDRLSSAIYAVEGDWNNPKLEFKHVFDGSKKSKSENQITEKNATDDNPALPKELQP